MATPASPFLSPFDRKIAGGPLFLLEAGKWHRDDDVLERLATATRLGELATLGAVRSVPGIWSHAATFSDLWAAGSVAEHPLRQMHAEVVASWRGLLAMVALAESSELAVELHSIRPDNQRTFLAEALPYCPPGLLDTGDGASAEALGTRLGYVLYADDTQRISWQVAGLLTPATLVLPAREFARPNDPRLTWTRDADDDGYPLGDPAASPRLRPKQRDALIAMVERLRAQTEALSNRRGSGKPLYPLVEALSAFLRDLKALPKQRVWTYRTQQREKSGLGAAFLEEPVAFLNESPRHSVGPPTDDVTDCALKLRDSHGQSKVLFYANSFHEDLPGQDDDEPVLWRDRTVSETTEALVREQLSRPDGPLAKGWQLLTADDIFAPRLIEFKDSDDGRPLTYFAHAPQLGRYLLPLKPAALVVMSPSELKNSLSLEESDEGVTIGLQITLVSTSGRRRICRIRRHYSRRLIRRQAVEPALLAVWPKFHADDWSHYFIWQQSQRYRDPTFEVTGAITRHSVQAGLEVLAKAQEQVTDFSWLQDGAQRAEFRDLTRGQQDDGVAQSVLGYASVPEALVCRAGEDEQDSGLLLLPLERFPPVERDVRWKISIDYGTTNTGLAYRPSTSEASESRPLGLANRTMLPFEEPQSDDKRGGDAYTLARYEFISPETVRPPFLTLVRKRATNLEGEGVVGGDTAIAFATGYDWLEQIKFYPARYLFGRKWELDRTSGSFLRQLVLQAAAEARAQGVPMHNIAWSFSLPGALGEDVAARYQDVARAAVGKLLGKERPAAAIDFPLESASALSYMMHFSRSSVGATQIVLDVGGHSTDIAIHGVNRAEALWEGSFEVGGRDIVVKDWMDEKRWPAAKALVSKNADLIASVGGEGYLDGFSDPEAQRILVEMVINRNGLPSEEVALAEAGPDAAALIRRVDLRADFVFFALTDYVLGVLKFLEQSGQVIDRRAGINFCGRGGVLLRRAWQPFAAPTRTERADQAKAQALRERFDRFVAQARDAHGTAASIEAAAFSSENDAKLEVALGAAAMTSVTEFASAKDRYPPPQGDSVHFFSAVLAAEGLNVAPTEAITKRQVKEAGTNLSLGKGDFDLPAYRGFLARYQDSLKELKLGGTEVEIATERLPSVIISGISYEFSKFLEDARKAERPSGFIQPIFLAAVKVSLQRWDDLVRQKG